MAEINRLFFCQLEEATVWASGDKAQIASALKPFDSVIIYQTGNGKVSSECRAIAKRLLATNHALIENVMDVNDDGIVKDMERRILQCNNPNLRVYFMKSLSGYKDRINVEEKYCCSIEIKNTLRVGSYRPPKAAESHKKDACQKKQSEKTVETSESIENEANATTPANKHLEERQNREMADNQKKERLKTGKSKSGKRDIKPTQQDNSSQTTNGDVEKVQQRDITKKGKPEERIISRSPFDILFSTHTHLNPEEDDVPKMDSEKQERTNHSKESHTSAPSTRDKATQAESPSDYQNKTDTAGNDPSIVAKRETRDSFKTKGETTRNPQRREKRNSIPHSNSRAQEPKMQSNNQKGSQMGKGASRGVAPPKMSMEEIHTMIFGTQIEDKFEEVKHSDMDNYKAHVINGVEDELIHSINLFIKGFDDLHADRAIYLEMISLLLTADDYDDFINGWEITQPNYRLPPFSKTDYEALCKRANNYAKLCEAMYPEGIW